MAISSDFRRGDKMKKIFKVVGINLLVLLSLLLLLEIVLRATGSKPVFQPVRNGDPQKSRWDAMCRKLCRDGKITVTASFFTDERGIFRGVPGPAAGDGLPSGKTRINSSGFRGNEFAFTDTPRTKVFFIGDSFTWGAAADPIDESFPDRVARAGYHVYNGGIPGTDPQQYARLAEIYVPVLKPDVTAVCLYLGNDLRSYVVPLLANRNLHFTTSAGFLRGYDDQGNYFASGEQALAYLKKRKCGCTDNPLEDFLYKTVVGKAVHGIFHMRNRLRPDPERKWVVECLERIDRVCRANGSRFLLFLVPNKEAKKNRRNLALVASFPGIGYHYPPDFIRADYRPDPDNHFNNRGHGKFAAFILDILKTEGYPPLR